ncbi:hypothetical protein AO385_1801 [Moraxella catarrhalis]|uniref:Uncharacterized protein n=1 Tax=Moraxella catarrhalis TaxID=480 RepID=A0A198UPV7_MORCA|nr:hypothetical protein AO385_1801 [Moraxella catarrhalis]OAU97287.1 hypothetical protein AO384_0669 [Moraxella catarrhalis]OAU98560.1 hypothetical protein AO383_0626 [Moraxella catarrhalis]
MLAFCVYTGKNFDESKFLPFILRIYHYNSKTFVSYIFDL